MENQAPTFSDALFKPFQLGQLALKNRIVMAPMWLTITAAGRKAAPA